MDALGRGLVRVSYTKVWIQRKGDRAKLRLEWLDPVTGKRRSVSTRTSDRAEAEAQRRKKEYELNNGLAVDPSTITWERFRELFRAEYQAGQRETSITKSDYVFDVFEQSCNPAKLSQIDERMISRFVVALRNRRVGGPGGKIGLEPITIRNYLVALKTALTWAEKQRLLPRCPDFPKIKVPKKKPQPIPTESFERLLDAEKDIRWKVFMCFGWWAGLRLSEVYALRWDRSDKWPWIDSANSRIVLPADFVKSTEDQWVPQHPQLVELLGQLDRTDPKVFPFVSKRTGQPLTRAGVTSHILMLAKRAGVRLSMHKLRKGFGCRVASLLGKGRAAILHRLMRHSSMQITMDYYANVDDALSSAMDELT